MIHISEEKLDRIFKQATGKKILVFGDLMVDEYLWGEVSRLSPEAPVPIVDIAEEQLRFGGAANVANNLIGLQATPILVGVVGRDRMGDVFREMLEKRNLPADGIVVAENRPTTVKTRIIGNDQHIARVDKETTGPISGEIQEAIFKICVAHMDEIEAVIIQDYNKGVVVPQLVERITGLVNRQGKYITVDPKFENFLTFKNVSVFKPNTKETEEALALRIRSEADVMKAGKSLLEKLHSRAVLITRGAQGMALFEENGEVTFVETRARKVADVSGAGDTVIATLSYALAGGANMKEAVTLSNYAAGAVCEEVGVVPILRKKLIKAVLKNQNNLNSGKRKKS
ncbi:MAG TPA: D-glycero-beta-D-manno-heptose-7-phosphate kinase [Caldithrix sp.]|nr:D-glycero-beta-D-manno-heptose-7-phosphate kinase [Caldithrix sp.]